MLEEKMENATKELENVYYLLVRNAFEDEFIFEEPGDCCPVYWELLYNVIYDDIRDVLEFDPNEEIVKRSLLKYLTTSEYDVYACILRKGGTFAIAYNADIGEFIKKNIKMMTPKYLGYLLKGGGKNRWSLPPFFFYISHNLWLSVIIYYLYVKNNK